jgi:putative PIN family toxin of toxin-antitoxin system
VWISAVINPYGTPARVVEVVMSGQVTAVVTQHLLDELAAVLIRPKFRRWLSVREAIAFAETLAQVAELQPDPGVAPRRVRDADDDYLAALAVATGAVLVTGDNDLLEADLDPPAITPRALLDSLPS